MYSFYGGPQGQSFSFSAIFPNRVALKDDLNQTGFSPVQLNEYVFINYGLQNQDKQKNIQDVNNWVTSWNDKINKNEALTEEEKLEKIEQIANTANLWLEKIENDKLFNINREEDNITYDNHSYNSTLWQKIYTKELIPAEAPNKFYYHNNQYYITDIEYASNVDLETSEFKYCYICLGVLNGYTPEFQLEQTVTLTPNKNPKVNLDNTNAEFPKIQFELPRAVQFHGIESLEDRQNNGDYYFNKEDGHIYDSQNIEPLTPYVVAFKFNEPTSVGGEAGAINFSENSTIFNKEIDVQLPYAIFKIGAVEKGTTAQVKIDNTDSLNPKLSFVLPQGEQGNTGQGLEILPASTIEIEDPDAKLTDEFIKSKLPQRIEVNQVLPIVISQTQDDNSIIETSYWCTYNNKWSILPLGGGGFGAVKLEWEELGN